MENLEGAAAHAQPRAAARAGGDCRRGRACGCGRDAARRERVERGSAHDRRQTGGMVVAARHAGFDGGFAGCAQRRPVSVRGAGVQRPGHAHDARRSRVHGLDGLDWQREEVVRHHGAPGDGRRTRDARARSGRRSARAWPAPPNRARKAGPETPRDPWSGRFTSIEVLGPGKDDKRRLELAYARTIGLDVAARMAEGVLVYELRVPLPVSEAQPYGVKSTPGATIGLGIETAKLQPTRRPGGRRRGAKAAWAAARRRRGRRQRWRRAAWAAAAGGWVAAEDSAAGWEAVLQAAAAKACAT